ncbi:MAG: 5'-nucleotidase C-terminal domain-containing protein [Vicinamibacteria bacterium]
MKSARGAACLLAAGILTAASVSASQLAEDREVTILYTNDFHSALDPIPAYWRPGSPRLGGAAQLSTLIGRLRARERTTFLFDSGDLFTGAFSFLTKGEALMRLWDVLGVDAMAIGNHEFDYGSAVFTPLMRGASFPVLGANIYEKATGARYARPWVVLERDGLKLGVIGIIGMDARSVALPSGITGLDFKDPVEEVRAAVKELRPRVDLVVVLAHQGKTGPMQTDAEARPEVQRDFAEDIALAGAVPGIDVFVGGHAHRGIERPYVHPKTGTLVVQTYGYGTRLGYLKLKLRNGRVADHRGELLEVRSDELPPDPRVVALLAPYREEARRAAGAPEGTLTARLVRDYRAESSLGDFVADVIREKTGADVAFENAGGLRADLPAGPVTRHHLIDALPFVNSLVTLEMTGRQIREVLEQGLTLERGLIQVSGVTGAYDLGRPVGSRLLSAQIGGRPLEDARTYRVGTHSFLAQGGDLYAAFLGATKLADTGVLLPEIVAEKLRASGTVSPPAGGRLVPRATTQAALEGIETLSKPDRFDKYPSLAYDAAGDLWCAFTTTDGDDDRVVVRRRRNGAWSEERRLDAGEGLESGAKLVLDGERRLRALWHGRRAGSWAVYTRVLAGEAWGAETRVSPAGTNALHPATVRDVSGRVWIAWEALRPGGFAVEIAVEQGRGWSAPARVASEGSDRRPALAAPPAGGVWLAWDSTRTGNFDVFLARARAAGAAPPRLEPPVAVTADAAIDDSPSLASGADGALWIAWNSMRGHSADPFRADRHSGDAFVRVYRDGIFSAPPGTAPAALAGQVSFGMADKSLRDVEAPYWHWKQTQNYPSVWLDGAGRAWVVWRTDATGAHNFDLWARVHDGRKWSPELHLTTFSPGRDEFPAAALGPDGSLALAWEAQALPKAGEELKGGDVDLYDTRSKPNAVLVGTLVPPADGWTPAEIAAAPSDHLDLLPDLEPPAPGPEPRTATAGNGRWHVYFGDPHSHSILSDAKTGLPDQLLALSRDRLALDFGVVSDHSEMGLLQPSEFAELRATAAAFDAPGRFVSLTGWEWTAGSAYGHRVLLYEGEGPERTLRSSDPGSDTIEALYRHARGHGAILSPHHTGNALWGRWNPGMAHDEKLEPNFEIASWHGRYEFYGNPREGRRQVPGHQYQDALRLGRHVGVMGASDTHHLSPGEGGLTAVLADRLDRASIFEAIRNRRNYATTGARIVLEFAAGGAPMGSILTAGGPLELAVRVEGTAPIDRVEIVRNLRDAFALVRMRQVPGAAEGEFLLYDPKQPQGGTWTAAPDARRVSFTVTDEPDAAGETSWYVRVTQADGEQAWSSPIWARR